MAPHSSTLAWKIPWTEEPGRLQSMGSLRVGHDFTFTFTFHFHALEKEMATHSSVLAWRTPGTGAWWAAVYGVTQSRTRLKRLSSGTANTGASQVTLVVKNMLANARGMRCGFDPQAGKIPRRRPQQFIPVSLPGESHGQRSLADRGTYSPLGQKELEHD